MAQRPPQRIEAPDSNKPSNNPATFIFLHGFGDDADGWINIAQQFHSAFRLPHLTWLFPNAPHNHEAMATAWYTPTEFSPIPVGPSSSTINKQESVSDDEGEEHEGEILRSVEYVCGLIDEEVARGVGVERIVIGGFSQGCAVGLVTGLASRYAGRVGAVVGLSGYLPKLKEVKRGGTGAGSGADRKMKVFLGHGTRDMLVPMRVFRECKVGVGKFVGEEFLESHEYEGMGHVTCGAEFRDLCEFLEKVLPP